MHGDYQHFTSYRTGLRTPILTRDRRPGAVSWAPGRLDVFARDGQRGELLRVLLGRLEPLAGLRAGARRPPDRAAHGRLLGARRLDVFAVDLVTGRLLQRSSRAPGATGSTAAWGRAGTG